MAEVRLIEVTKIYDKGVVGVKNATFTVKDGEFCVILGPSGCGKTTTLRLIAGLETITSGDIYIGDKKVNNVPPKDRDIAMVFQNYALYPHMNVYDNMAFGLKMRKIPKHEIHQRVLKAAKMLGIEALLDRKPKELSGGQRQRVALGRAIVREPKVFLFDEPLSNLDAKMRVKMRAELSRLHKELHATSIYVTHDQVEAMTLADKIVLINKGEIQQIADPLTMYHKPANRFVAGFIGSPPMNFFEGTLVEEDGALYFKSEDFKVAIPENKAHLLKLKDTHSVILGIRPENMRVQSVGEIIATVDFHETLGNEILLYLSTEHFKFIVRMEPIEPPASGSKIAVKLNLEKIHIFDAESGKNLTI